MRNRKRSRQAINHDDFIAFALVHFGVSSYGMVERLVSDPLAAFAMEAEIIALIDGEQPETNDSVLRDHLKKRVAILHREALYEGRYLVKFPLDT